jgi:hypothetical protein
MLIAYNYSATEMSQLEKQNDLKISVLYGQQCIMNTTQKYFKVNCIMNEIIL